MRVCGHLDRVKFVVWDQQYGSLGLNTRVVTLLKRKQCILIEKIWEHTEVIVITGWSLYWSDNRLEFYCILFLINFFNLILKLEILFTVCCLDVKHKTT